MMSLVPHITFLFSYHYDLQNLFSTQVLPHAFCVVDLIIWYRIYPSAHSLTMKLWYTLYLYSPSSPISITHYSRVGSSSTRVLSEAKNPIQTSARKHVFFQTYA